MHSQQRPGTDFTRVEITSGLSEPHSMHLASTQSNCLKSDMQSHTSPQWVIWKRKRARSDLSPVQRARCQEKTSLAPLAADSASEVVLDLPSGTPGFKWIWFLLELVPLFGRLQRGHRLRQFEGRSKSQNTAQAPQPLL